MPTTCALSSPSASSSPAVSAAISDRERPVDRSREPDPAVVEGDHVEALLQRPFEWRAPGNVRPAHPLDQQQRLPRAGPLVMELPPRNLDFRHRRILSEPPDQRLTLP